MILIILSFLNLSVAREERSRALYINPAGLSIHSSPEISLRTDDYWLSMNLPFLGFAGGVRFKSDSIEYMTGASPLNYKDRFSLGYMYSSWNGKYTLGVMARPVKWTSFGATTTFPSREGYSFDFGVALRPGIEWFTLSSDFGLDREADGAYDFSFRTISGIVEVLKGVKIDLAYSPDEDDFSDGTIYGGLQVSLGNLLFGGYGGGNAEEGIVTASVIPYPTFLRKKPKSVIVEIKGDYPEVPKTRGIFGERHAFYFLLNLLDYVRGSEEIDTVLVRIRGNSLGLAQVEEVRGLLAEISEKKHVMVYANSLSFKNYYLSSAGDIIGLPPSGELFFPGLYMSKMYVKGALEKLDIEPEIERVGEYKSAVEMFTRDEMSEEDRKQISVFLDDIVTEVVSKISGNRGISEDALKSLVDSLGYFTPDVAYSKGLIDTVFYFDEAKKSAGIEGEGKIWRGKRVPRSFVVETYPKIVILALEGSIIVGESSKAPFPVPLFGGSTIGSETVVEKLNELRKDKSVKAVVLRIDSPGGSSLASDLIYRAIMKLKEEKPVVVSMGNVAASGGYYISAPATKILAQRTTLTGSIGIFGMKFVTEGFYNKLGINREVVKWGEHSDALGPHRPFTHYERKMYERMIEHGYRQFIGKVAANREITTEQVDSIGRGRIWSGLSAREIKLVDEVGGLLDAIKVASEEAGIDRYKITLLPEPIKLFEKLLGVESNAYSSILDLIKEPYIYYEPAQLRLNR